MDIKKNDCPISTTVKSEISQMNLPNNTIAMLYGFLILCRDIKNNRFHFLSDNPDITALFLDLLYTNLTIEPELINASKLEIIIDKPKDIDKINRLFDNIFSTIELDKYITDTEQLIGFLKAVFLKIGTLNNPQKGYRLEFACSDISIMNKIDEFLSQTENSPFFITFLKTKRGEQTVLYLKDSTKIEDFFAFIGCSKVIFEIANTKIIKSYTNQANRIRNCEVANISKTVKASSEQIEAINYLKTINKFKSLPDELIDIAKIRLKNPEYSFQEIGDSLCVKLSRSGVNHRIKRIIKIAEQYKSENSK